MTTTITMNVRKILCAVNLSDNSRRVAEKAVYVAQHLDSQLEIVHVVPSVNQFHGIFVSTESLSHCLDTMKEDSEPVLRRFVEENFPNLGITHQILMGDPGEAIAKRANEDDIDMVVLGAHGRRTLESMVMGNVGEYLVRHCHKYVLTIPSEKANRPGVLS